MMNSGMTRFQKIAEAFLTSHHYRWMKSLDWSPVIRSPVDRKFTRTTTAKICPSLSKIRWKYSKSLHSTNKLVTRQHHTKAYIMVGIWTFLILQRFLRKSLRTMVRVGRQRMIHSASSRIRWIIHIATSPDATVTILTLHREHSLLPCTVVEKM